MALHYEEQLMRWEDAVYTHPELSIRITDGRYRLATHIRLPLNLSCDAQEVWRQERREDALSRFRHLTL